MKSILLGLLAETSIHPGSGRSTGFVDLPVAREAATDYPVIVGSSVKGALRDLAYTLNMDRLNETFGDQDRAGALLVSDARLLLLPVRSLTSQYKWVTCPHLIERLDRDCSLAAVKGQAKASPPLERGNYLGLGNGDLFLEERQFGQAGPLPAGLSQFVSRLIAHHRTGARLDRQLVILHDDDFVWFARYGLSVNARNVLNEEKKTSKNLWYEETIPPDSLFYCLLAERTANGTLESVKNLFKDRPYIQVGGNETVGQGWFAVKFLEEGPK